MALVCIDTQILYWALIKIAPSSKPHIVSLATDFMQWIEKEKHDVIIPNIVVGELLIRVPPEKHLSVISQFQQNWRLVPFDTPASIKFAEIRRQHAIDNRLKDLLDPANGSTRAALKADVMIVATAIVHGANVIYSDDTDIPKLSKGFIEAKSMSDVEFPRTLI